MKKDLNEITTLVVDIGNTMTAAGFFKGKKLIDKDTHPSDQKEISLEEIENHAINFAKRNPELRKIDYALVSSVVPGLTRISQIIIQHNNDVEPHVLKLDMVKNLKMKIDNPNEVGGDLLADLVGATNYYGGPCVIIDLGTVSKFLAVDENNCFVGASFAPGLKSSFNALSGTTALLPPIDALKVSTSDEVPFIYGKNTIDCMKSGIYWSCVAYVNDIATRIEKTLGKNVKKILTGGYAKFVLHGLDKDKYILDEDLVLKGLNLIALENIK